MLAWARASRRAGRRRGSEGWPRCAGCPAVLGFGSCRITRFACFAALRSNRMRQVRSRSARVRAPTQSLCSSAAPIRPACAPPGALRATASVCEAPHATPVRWPEGGAAPGRLCAAEERRAWGRARSALRKLTRRTCSSAVSAANASELCDGPQGRAPQGTLAQRGPALGAPAPYRPRARAEAPQADVEVRQWAGSGHGLATRSRASCVAPSAVGPLT